MSRLKRIILVILTVLLLGGCNSRQRKLRKMNKKAEQLLEDDQYALLVDLYSTSLEEGVDHDAVIEAARSRYTKWVEYQTAKDGTDSESVFVILDDMGERFPELKEDSEEMIVKAASSFMIMNYSGDLKGLNKFWQEVIQRYYWSDTICYGIDRTYRTQRRLVVNQEIQDLVKAGFLTDIINREYKNVFNAFEISDLYHDIYALKKQIDFPVIETVGSKQLGIEFIGNSVVLYYGTFDSENKRSGEGVHMFYFESSKATFKSLVYGNFTNDILNGEFEEYTVIDSDAWREGVVTGNMVDNKYDGEIKMTLTTPKSTTDYTMQFENGKAVAEGTYVDDNGDTIYVVASAWIDGKQRVYGYPQDFYDAEHGLQPWYERAY